MSRADWPDDVMRTLAETFQPSANALPRVRLHGTVYRLVGSLEDGGAIATDEQFEHGECSFAHLTPDGAVMRFGTRIATRDDLELLP